MNTRKPILKIMRVIDLLVIFVFAFGSPLGTLASVWTDQQDYQPGSVVTISGNNDNGIGYLAGETVHVDVAGPNGYTAACEGVAANDANAAWSCQVTLWEGLQAVGTYTYTTLGLQSLVTESGTFTDAVGDFSIDFVGAAPYSYNHLVGGGAYDDRTVGKNLDIVESLEAVDFACGDIVTFLTQIVVDDTARAQTDAPQTIELDYEFLMDTTGQSGVAIGDILTVQVNRAPIVDLIAGEDTTDQGIIDDGGSVATLISESQTGPMFQAGSELLGTVQVTDLERNEDVIVRVDTRLYCKPGSNPTGNLQGAITAGRLTYIQGSVPVTPPANISVGNQTIPFYQFGALKWPVLDIQKTVTTSAGTCPGTESLNISSGDTVKYCYAVQNTGAAAMYDVTSITDDNRTPGNTADDFTVTLTGLTDVDGDGQMDDLAAGGSASGEALVTVAPTYAGTYTNTGVVGGFTFPNDTTLPLTDSDTASVVVPGVPSIMIQKTPDTQTVIYGNTASFTIVVTNNGNVDLTNVNVSDPLVPNCAATIGTLLAGANNSFTCSLANVTSNFTNVATATGTYGSTTVTDNDDAVVTVDFLPTVDLTKAVTPATYAEPGGVFNYTLTIHNTSNEIVTITALTDDNSLPATCTDLIGTSLAADDGQAGGFDEVTCSYTVNHSEAGSYDNTASVTVQDNTGNYASDSDSETVTVTDVLPTVDLTKGVTPETLPEPGDGFLFTLSIHNTSVEAVTISSLTDDNALSAECLALIGTSVPADGTVSCTYTVSYTEAGSHDNTATVIVADNEDNTATDSDSATVTVTDVLPTVVLTKSAAPATLPEPGGDFVFTLSIHNTSVEAVTITALTDNNALSDECLALIGTSIPADGTISCTYTVSHTAVGSYANTANVTVEDNEGNSTSDSDDETVTVTDVLPTIDLTKTADPLTLPEPGGAFVFTLSIHNTSAEDVTITALTDENALSAECLALVNTNIPAGGTVTCTYTVSYTDAGSYDNTASVTVTDNEGTTATDTDSETVTVTDEMPIVDLTKSAAPATLPEPGGDFVFTLSIHNTSVEAVTITTLTDDNALSAECLALVGTSIAAGATVSCTYTVSHTDAGSYDNTASVTVTDNDGNTTSDSDTETVTVTDVAPDITITKTANPTDVPETGGDVTFTFFVDNIGVEDVTLTSLTDTVFGNLFDHELNPTSTCASVVIPVGGDYTCAITVHLAADDLAAHNNVVTAIGTDNEGGTDTASDDETVTFDDVKPMIVVTKAASYGGVSPAVVPETGGDVTFTFLVENVGEEDVTLTSLTDTVFGDLNGQGTCVTGGLIPVGEDYSCAITVHLAADDLADHTNVATGVGTDDDGSTAEDSDSETVTFEDLLPTVDLTKNVTPATLPEPGGVFYFTLTIVNNSVENVTITALTDANALSTECLALVDTVLTPGQSVSCEYDVTHTETGSYPNTASVTVADNDGNTDDDSDTETVTVTDEMPVVDLTKDVTPATLPEPGGVFHFTLTIVNNSVENVTITALTDDNALSTECLALVDTVLTPGQMVSCTYDVTHTQASTYSNTASVTVDDNEGNTVSDSDTETVTVTDVLPTVSLTKTAYPLTRNEPGGNFVFTLSIHNTSVEAVTITALTDDNVLSAGCNALVGTTLAADDLQPGGPDEASCTYEVIHTDPGIYLNTAEVTVQDTENNFESASDDESVTVVDILPSVDLTKDVTPADRLEPGGVFHFTVKIYNLSAEQVTITAFDDTQTTACDYLFGAVLAADDGASGGPDEVTCEYDVTHTEAGSYANTASVTVADNENSPVSDSDTETVTVTDEMPVVDLTKDVTPATLAEPGGVFHFTLTIVNNSVENITITALTDDNPLPAACTDLIDDVLTPGQSVSCTYDVTHTEAGSYANTASVTVADNEGNPVSDSDSETVTVTDVHPTVDLTKDVTLATLAEPGGVFHFTLTIVNNSVENVTITALTDDNPLPAACTDLIGYVLTSGQSVFCEYDVTHTEAGSYANTASVTVADNEGNPVSDSDSETVTVTDVHPTVDLTKTAGSATYNVGDVATFTLYVQNTSPEAVTITALTDTNALSAECQALLDTSIAAGQTVSCTYTVVIETAGVYENTASVTVQDNENNTDDDTDTEEITLYAPAVSKDAYGTYSEMHDWEVFKSVNTASQTAFAGEFRNFTWTVRVDETTHGETYLVTGDIVINNPNPDDAMTLSLSDVLDDGTVATIGPCDGGTLDGNNLTVPANTTVTCDYTANPTGDLQDFADGLPAQVTMSVQYPYNGGPAYFPVTTISGHPALNGTYEGWCVDTDHTITQNTNYTVNVYSSYETLPAGLVEHPENFDLVNWIINQDFVGQPAGGSLGNYTYSDVQYAIWTLIDDQVLTNGLYNLNTTRAAQIVAAAQASGEGFTPTCGDFIAVVLQPVGGQQSITIAQVTFASLGVSCAESNTVTAVLNGIEFPASAEILWTANPINATATLDDDQKLDWPITVSADQTFTYADPQGYTCSSLPGAYTNGYYQYPESNTAVLTYSTGSKNAVASTAVKCYAPVVTKLAAGVYDERHEWDVEKSVDPLTQNILAGNTDSINWTVIVDESVYEEHFVASGTISVKNPRTDDGNMTVKLTDLLGDNTPATITGCSNGTWNDTNKTVAVAPNQTAVCSYTTAVLEYGDDALAPTGNTVTAELMHGTTHLVTTASDAIEWQAIVIRGSATLSDELNSAFPLEVTDDGTYNYTTEYACSVNLTEYTSGHYLYTEDNTATVTSGEMSDSAFASADVHCYYPLINIDKVTVDGAASGDDLIILSGESIKWQYTVTNPGSVPLSNVVVTDSELGITLAYVSGDSSGDDLLDPGESWIYEASGTAITGNYSNTGTATGSWTDDNGNTGNPSDSDSSSYFGADPSFTVAKACKASTEPIPQEGPAKFTVTFVNTGNVALSITADDGITSPFDLAVGETKTFEVSLAGPFSGLATADNTVNASSSYTDSGLHEWTSAPSASASCRVGSRANVLKLTQSQVDPTKTWTFSIWSGADGFGGTQLATSSTNGDLDGLLTFGNLNLDKNLVYTLCEESVPAGWTSFWQVDSNNDGIVDATLIPYNPNASDNPPEDLGNRCVDFGAGTGTDLLTDGGTLLFQVNNTYPGGEPRTPGYWKNWNRVTGGGQADNADRNGGYMSGYWLVEDVLDPAIGGGITWDDILVDGFVFQITKAAVAVDILDQRDVANEDVVFDGAKHASDAAYTLAMHLLAAQLNFGSGARTCDAATDAALAGEELLDKYNFNGTGSYLLNNDKKVKTDYNLAISLASTLDQYNNGVLCSGPAVSFFDPKDGDVVTGAKTIVVNTIDMNTVTQVEFFVDGASIGVDNTAADGWSILWDSTTVADGSRVLSAVATNNLAQTGSADVTITVDNVADPVVQKMHVGDLSATVAKAKAGKWNATVTVTIHDPNHAGLSGVVVSMTWSDGIPATCTTGAAGTCTFTRANIGSAVPSLTLDVTNLTLSGYEYDSTLNEKTSITVNKPL